MFLYGLDIKLLKELDNFAAEIQNIHLNNNVNYEKANNSFRSLYGSKHGFCPDNHHSQ